ncbi:hypothetical protein X759_22525 [Mesorhizobium sp. LSHC420B00]|nr:hypothetical protein X759_22525 [Mesorhizobium sp. LSHC420B00]
MHIGVGAQFGPLLIRDDGEVEDLLQFGSMPERRFGLDAVADCIDEALVVGGHRSGVQNLPFSVLDVFAEEGMTMMVVTHGMGFARKVAQRVVFMDAGAIVESGTPDEFFSNPKTDRSRAFLSKILRH